MWNNKNGLDLVNSDEFAYPEEPPDLAVISGLWIGWRYKKLLKEIHVVSVFLLSLFNIGDLIMYSPVNQHCYVLGALE